MGLGPLWEAHLFCPYLKALAPGFGGSWYNEASSRGGGDDGEWPRVGGSDGGQEILLSCQVPGPPSVAGAEQQTLVSQHGWELELPVCEHVGFV